MAPIRTIVWGENIHDREDEKVRPNHHLLHGFIARTNWGTKTALKTPPTRIGFQVTGTPASAATSSILWKAR